MVMYPVRRTSEEKETSLRTAEAVSGASIAGTLALASTVVSVAGVEELQELKEKPKSINPEKRYRFIAKEYSPQCKCKEKLGLVSLLFD